MDQIFRGVLNLAKQAGSSGCTAAITQEPCAIEGIIMRNCDESPVEQFKHHVFKYVSMGHVKTVHPGAGSGEGLLSWKKEAGNVADNGRLSMG